MNLEPIILGMSKHGRFGKYGEKKRIERLRQSRSVQGQIQRKGISSPRKTAHHKGKTSSKTRVTTRHARPSEVDYIQHLSKKVFHKYGPYEIMLPRWFEAVITETVLAMMGKKPVGFAMFTRPAKTWVFPRACELLAIAVEPERQGQGAGDLILSEIERMAGDLGIEKMVLHTGVENMQGQRLFRKHGFAPAQIKINFYPEGQDALMMYKDLSPNNG
ncbi:MAG: GNAT family N-acetyltransferase [Deltaproteobacteria bacterium]|nr:GNAT family N-acetyltransferase [Deltaproteobacteria bacterium]